ARGACACSSSTTSAPARRPSRSARWPCGARERGTSPATPSPGPAGSSLEAEELAPPRNLRDGSLGPHARRLDGLRGEDGEREQEGRAGAGLALDPHLALLEDDERLRDGQAQAGAAD